MTGVLLAVVVTNAAWGATAASASAHYQDSEFLAVSCATAQQCKAVGYVFSPNVSLRGLTETVSSSGSHAQAFPGGLLYNSVSCPAVTVCFAVTGDLVREYQDGRWSTVFTDTAVTDALISISCPTVVNCTALGSRRYTRPEDPMVTATLADGAWTTGVIKTPTFPVRQQQDAPYFFSLSCATTSNCVAVGEQREGPIVAVESGGVWSSQDLAVPTKPDVVPHLLSVSCWADDQCVAVGSRAGKYFTNELAMRLDGSTWTRMAATVPAGYGDGNLSSVSCPSAGSCVAVGGEGIVETFANGAWTASRFSAPGFLTSVSCPDATECVAAGNENQDRGFVATLAAGSWTVTTPPLP